MDRLLTSGTIAIGAVELESREKYRRLKSELVAELKAIERVRQIVRTIHDERLYRAEFPTFEMFCKKVMNRTRDAVYKRLAK